MRNYFIGICSVLVVLAFIVRCNTKSDKKQSVSQGNLDVMVDETLKPIIDDQIAVFESGSETKINLIAKSELEIVNALLKDSIKFAILSRELTKQETDNFQKRKINPRISQFATDAIVLIKNMNSQDSLISLTDVVAFMNGKKVEAIKGLVFDNPNSSTVRQLCEIAKVKKPPVEGIFSFENNNEAINYVAKNDGMIGVVGLNWLLQPTPEMQNTVKKVKVLSVKGFESDSYYSPTQNNIAENKYPLARDLFIVNCQGFEGLGMAFSLFVTGDRGQRIILKSGLLPAKIPGRRIVVRKKVEKEDK